MKVSKSLISLLVLSHIAFGSALAVNAQQNSSTLSATPKAPAVETPITPTGASPETPPAASPNTEMAPASGSGTPSVAPATEMKPKSMETSPASSGGGSPSKPMSSLSSGSTSSKVLAMCGSSSAAMIVDSGSAPIGCRESMINSVPAAALK